MAVLDHLRPRAIGIDHRYAGGVHHGFADEALDDPVHHLLQLAEELAVLVVQELFLVAEDGDLDRLVEFGHHLHRLSQALRVLLDGRVHVAAEFHRTTVVDDDHRNGGVLLYHLQQEGEIAEVAADEPLLRFGIQFNAFAFLVAQRIEEAVGIVDQLRAVLHRLRPEFHFAAFLIAHFAHYAVAVEK